MLNQSIKLGIVSLLLTKVFASEYFVTLGTDEDNEYSDVNSQYETKPLIVRIDKSSVSPEVLEQLSTVPNIMFADLPGLPQFVNLKEYTNTDLIVDGLLKEISPDSTVNTDSLKQDERYIEVKRMLNEILAKNSNQDVVEQEKWKFKKEKPEKPEEPEPVTETCTKKKCYTNTVESTIHPTVTEYTTEHLVSVTTIIHTDYTTEHSTDYVTKHLTDYKTNTQSETEYKTNTEVEKTTEYLTETENETELMTKTELEKTTEYKTKTESETDVMTETQLEKTVEYKTETEVDSKTLYVTDHSTKYQTNTETTTKNVALPTTKIYSSWKTKTETSMTTSIELSSRTIGMEVTSLVVSSGIPMKSVQKIPLTTVAVNGNFTNVTGVNEFHNASNLFTVPTTLFVGLILAILLLAHP